jgi:hypothetical protein
MMNEYEVGVSATIVDCRERLVNLVACCSLHASIEVYRLEGGILLTSPLSSIGIEWLTIAPKSSPDLLINDPFGP